MGPGRSDRRAAGNGDADARKRDRLAGAGTARRGGRRFGRPGRRRDRHRRDRRQCYRRPARQLPARDQSSLPPAEPFAACPPARPMSSSGSRTPPRRSARCAGVRRSRPRAGAAYATPPRSPRTAPSRVSPFGQASTSEDCLYLNVFTPPGSRAGQPPSARHGVDPRRRAGDRREQRLRPHQAGRQRRDRRHHQLPPRRARLPGPPGARQPARRPVRRLRPDGSAGGAALGAAQHRPVRRRPAQRDHLRRVGRRPLACCHSWPPPARTGCSPRRSSRAGPTTSLRRRWPRPRPPGEAFATSAGCASQTAACLRSLPVPPILTNQTATGYTPDIDGQVLTQSIGTALSSGQFNRVPVINGTQPRRMAAVRGRVRAGGRAGHRGQLPEHDRVDSRGPPRDRGRHRGAVPAERLPEPVRRARRGRHRRDLRLPRADGGQLGVEVRADVSPTSSTTRTRRSCSCRRSASRTARRTRPSSSTCST